MNFTTLTSYFSDHPEQLPVVLGGLTLVARAAYAALSHVVAPYPRLRALVEALAAASPDLVRALQQTLSALLGRPVASLDRRAPTDDRAALLARAQRAEREVARLRDTIASTRAATVPSVPAPHRDDGQSGYGTLGALSAVLVGVLAYALVAASITGCPHLPPQSGCTDGAQTCQGDHPAVCSASGRWHRAGDLACAEVGGACVVRDGRAFCATVLDGGSTDAGGEQ